MARVRPPCKMRNVSTTFAPMFSTGDVLVTQMKRSSWQVHERGREPFLVRSMSKAFREACRLQAARGTGRR